METLFIEFKIHNNKKFEMLKEIFYELKKEKQQNLINSDDSKWLDYFDEEALDHFWWPTEKEEKEYWKLYMSIPVPQRHTDERLKTPWDFSSMIDAIACGEYELKSCEEISEHIGRLEFDTWSWPYGGADSIKALIKAFGFDLLREEI